MSSPCQSTAPPRDNAPGSLEPLSLTPLLTCGLPASIYLRTVSKRDNKNLPKQRATHGCGSRSLEPGSAQIVGHEIRIRDISLTPGNADSFGALLCISVPKQRVL